MFPERRVVAAGRTPAPTRFASDLSSDHHMSIDPCKSLGIYLFILNQDIGTGRDNLYNLRGRERLEHRDHPNVASRLLLDEERVVYFTQERKLTIDADHIDQKQVGIGVVYPDGVESAADRS